MRKKLAALLVFMLVVCWTMSATAQTFYAPRTMVTDGWYWDATEYFEGGYESLAGMVYEETGEYPSWSAFSLSVFEQEDGWVAQGGPEQQRIGLVYDKNGELEYFYVENVYEDEGYEVDINYDKDFQITRVDYSSYILKEESEMSRTFSVKRLATWDFEAGVWAPYNEETVVDALPPFNAEDYPITMVWIEDDGTTTTVTVP